jgi:hypothetical protein
MNILKIITELIENPSSIRAYKDWLKYYEAQNREQEVQAIRSLIIKKFNDNSTPNN